MKERPTKELDCWDHRTAQLRLQEQANKPSCRPNSEEARKRADALQARMQKRLEELRLERQISPLPPVVLGGLLAVSIGLLALMGGEPPSDVRTRAATQAAARFGLTLAKGEVPG